MTLRALASWLLLLALAFANGTFRELLLVPRLGSLRAHQVSTLMLSAGILLMTWFVILWIRPARASQAWAIGAVWVALTLCFEFGLGRAQGKPWSMLLADYDLLAGRIWPLVLLVTFVAPWIAARLRHLIA